MSLTTKDKGRILARIDGGKNNKKIVSVLTEYNDKPIKKISIEDSKFQHLPNPDTERSILYITGASGSGKSTYTANYVKIYKKLFPDNPVYLFSELPEDESLDVVKPKRFKISKETLIDDPINIDDLKNSIVIFDDTDNISDKNLKQVVYNILNKILETGRHYNISCVITNHLPSNGSYTRKILNECHTITYFPNSGSVGKIKKFLEEYVGLDKKDFIKNKKAKSRWATIFKNYPMVNMTEREIRLLGDSDNESDEESEKSNSDNDYNNFIKSNLPKKIKTKKTKKTKKTS